MESTAVPPSGSAAADPVSAPGTGAGAGEKGLKKNAIGFVSSVVIGVASTAPGYSLDMLPGSLEEYAYPDGPDWSRHEALVE